MIIQLKLCYILDTGRTDELQNYEITVIRFTNDHVINNIEAIIHEIEEKIKVLKSKL